MADQPDLAFSPPEPVVVQAPTDGWTWTAYDQAIQSFTRERGRAPHTVTLHPDTMETVLRTKLLPTEEKVIERAVGALQREEARVEARLDRLQQGDRRELQVIKAPEHDRQTIVLE